MLSSSDTCRNVFRRRYCGNGDLRVESAEEQDPALVVIDEATGILNTHRTKRSARMQTPCWESRPA